MKRAFAKEARIPIAEVERFEARVITGGVGQDVIVLLRGEKHWVRTPLGEIRFGRVVAPLNGRFGSERGLIRVG